MVVARNQETPGGVGIGVVRDLQQRDYSYCNVPSHLPSPKPPCM